jgi:hypothetical protein
LVEFTWVNGLVICCLILQIDERWGEFNHMQTKKVADFCWSHKDTRLESKNLFLFNCNKDWDVNWIDKKKLLVLTLHLRWVVITSKKPCRFLLQKNLITSRVCRLVDPHQKLGDCYCKKISTSRVFLQIVVEYYWSHQEFAKSCVDHHIKSLQILIDHNNDSKWSSRELSLFVLQQYRETMKSNFTKESVVWI